MLEKLLIANRGEIAVRIISACRELGIRTLAVYSQADEDSLHVHLADEAICIGDGPADGSYLRMDRILAAAELGNVDAIHPGYGFLSENAKFAEQCRACGIAFVGPGADVIARLGDKARARDAALRAKVPVLPGSDGPVERAEDGLRQARRVGFPILLKAVSGGGGKGMRLVRCADEFFREFAIAQVEAEKNFGDGRIYFEKFLGEPRHIEFQILADGHGHVLHLGERDCSIQRRYQKLIEEAPSPALDASLRRKMGEAAVRLAKSCSYQSAGTVEFLLDRDGKFYFMEMNTRIQVEHGVTEMVTGIDLVQWQLRIAAGERLDLEQKDVRMSGHAVECRINAEDPSNSFAPQPGTISLWYLPGGPGIRIDSHAYGGYRIPHHYDSLLGKIIAIGRDRTSALRKMESALAAAVVQGIHTTIPYLREIFADQIFQSGHFATNFLEKFSTRHGADLGQERRQL
ncbi:MAG: acetyl-CoA carboxylase biotin carboxylase subunit [Puniceicoccales bacterium]|jgi:acetyl-CoA carboxylase biotin carboxylase subunit|nr:acetyl-CoA carboxylase biotin carboxylase subunit [Puniceicoccales bacterium]